jgi:hypothetical protein
LGGAESGLRGNVGQYERARILRLSMDRWPTVQTDSKSNMEPLSSVPNGIVATTLYPMIYDPQ